MINEDRLISDLYRSFNQDNVVLFAGSDAVDNGYLTDAVCGLPWSCVITTVKNDEFGFKFAQGRNPRKYISSDELPINLFNRDSLPIIHMFGTESEMPQGAENVPEKLQSAYLNRNAEKIVNRVMSKMDIRSRLVVVGYNSDSGMDFPLESFVLSFQENRGGSVTFFNPDSSENQELKEFAIKADFAWIDGNIADFVADISGYFEDVDRGDDTHLFYKGQKPAFIKKSILSRSRQFAQLLTEERVKEVRPLGRIQQSRWFYNFLNYSSDSPQWYGYLPQSEFYLKRCYEDTLLELVRRLLSGQILCKSGWNTPIVLEGDPGSSKSIELAAVAYKVYEEKNNPVIYINGDSAYFAGQSNEIQLLDELMQEVEQVGEKDTRFLIVWDSSSYRNITVDIKQLAHELENRGRRFVLLCSAYSHAPSDRESESKASFSYKKGHGFEKTDGRGDLYFSNGCYYVSASRDLNSSEINKLKQKAALYAVADREEINRVWNELEGTVDIFNYFYKLIILIRPKLEAGLSKEQRLVNRYVRRQFALLEKKEKNFESPFIEAFKKAGIDLDEESLNALSEDDDEDSSYDLDKFCICIAMFSRFKLDTPYSLALSMLCKEDSEYFGSNKQYNNYELFNLLTSQINYIHYLENNDGRYVFRFRNSLEAKVFLKNNQIYGDGQLKVVEEMIERYVESYRQNNEVDVELKESIQAILQMYGPNTYYKEFWQDHSEFEEHQNILRKLGPLAEKVQELRTKYHIPDTDGGMALIEICFLRELYGNLWDTLKGYSHTLNGAVQPWEKYPDIYTEDSYVFRLGKLENVSNLALECLERLEVRMNDFNDYASLKSILTAINALTVELALANREMERIGTEYRKMSGKKLDDQISKPLSYTQLYPILVKTISASPLNGYLYNALFNLFEKEYDNSGEERRLSLLSDVGMIADDASTLEITNRGAKDKDELSEHLHKIAQYSCKYTVRIDDMISGEAPEAFKKLFESTVDRNNASGICFVCQQELISAGLSGDAISKFERENEKEFVLSKEQLNTCQKIVDFINRPEYVNCVENSIQALYLLLRVEWMLYNGRPLSIGREWQITYLSPEDWIKVCATCEKYENISGSSVRPVVSLIYALAKIQINGDYLGAVRIMHKVSDMPNQRMRVPYLICFEKGKPESFSGTVLSTHNYSGFIQVKGLPKFSEKNRGVKFYMRNMRLRHMPEKNEYLKDFYLGLSLANQFSAYRFEEANR